jgi:hypothetical protein
VIVPASPLGERELPPMAIMAVRELN